MSEFHNNLAGGLLGEPRRSMWNSEHIKNHIIPCNSALAEWFLTIANV